MALIYLEGALQFFEDNLALCLLQLLLLEPLYLLCSQDLIAYFFFKSGLVFILSIGLRHVPA